MAAQRHRNARNDRTTSQLQRKARQHARRHRRVRARRRAPGAPEDCLADRRSDQMRQRGIRVRRNCRRHAMRPVGRRREPRRQRDGRLKGRHARAPAMVGRARVGMRRGRGRRRVGEGHARVMRHRRVAVASRRRTIGQRVARRRHCARHAVYQQGQHQQHAQQGGSERHAAYFTSQRKNRFRGRKNTRGRLSAAPV